ncbi:HNH endonuclease [Nocardioides marmoribigeumensis]|uniref:Restriction endonuclease n=1 Tax=Nocardioides marmoribigeumensis TaxID=433649 RepID=A0ABU2BY82_9ACTN|nr:HNH endonuclease [Nocardioides marmoribigeumensis]MDR7363368.1 putative restriction endonuclease [Nocardioides marmoribigeumensis]
MDYNWLRDFKYNGVQIPLMDRQRGIRKPAGMQAALAIRTTFTPPGGTPPYADSIGPDGLQRYKYRGDDPNHAENRALRRAGELKLPLIWFVGVAEGVYEPIYPVWVVNDEPAQLQFALAVDPAQRFLSPAATSDPDSRAYVERLTKARLHQRVFRTQIMLAYETRCAVCALRHDSLLDAAHIIADGQPDGLPVVPNGLALCKIHHAAYDGRILGIRPDLTLHVREDILAEVDGPMLRHGLQEMHDQRLMAIPKVKAARPDVDRLERRYQAFLAS